MALLLPDHVAALVPCHRDPPAPGLIDAIRRFVGRVLIVDDGSPEATARVLDGLAEQPDVELLRLPGNSGKGHAVAAGIRYLLGREPPPEAVVVVDSDGQHPPSAIPAFLEAARDGELVVGDRFGDVSAMPWERRLANRLANTLLTVATRRIVRDSQCGMRLLRGRALHDVPFPGGGYEAETLHLKRCLARGVPVGWVPIPAVYAEEVSSFRPLRDTGRVLRALLSR